MRAERPSCSNIVLRQELLLMFTISVNLVVLVKPFVSRSGRSDCDQPGTEYLSLTLDYLLASIVAHSRCLFESSITAYAVIELC